MLLTEFVLRLNLLEFLAGVDEEDVVVLLAAFLHHQNTGGNAGPIENISRQADDGIDVVLLLNKELANLSFSRSTEKNTVRRHASHCTAVVQVINHVKDEGVVCFGFWSQDTGLAETIIVVELGICRPLSRERRICYYGIKLTVAEFVFLQSVTVLDVEITVLHAV